jgi:multicomponent K+:H+ antiporter subunit A
VLLYALVCATALMIPGIESRVLRVLMLGSCGFCVTGVYLVYQAPDLALTQIMFELVSVVLFLLVLRLLPEKAAADAMPSNRERIPRAVLAAVAGLAMGWTVLTIATDVDHENVERLARVQETIPEAEIISTAAASGHGDGDKAIPPANTSPEDPQQLGQWFVDHTYDGMSDTEGRGGGGHNVVNVILVDFRGYDTLGEITVLMITLLGVLALLASAGPAVLFAPGGPQPHLRSILLRTSMRLILPLALIFAGYVFFKGHNSPGGGFIAGLIASVALAVFRMSEGGGCLRKLLPIRPGTLGALGLLLAFATAVLPMLYGFAPGGTMFEILRSHHQYIPLTGDDKFHFTSVLFFDTGVFMVVVAVAAGLVNRFEEELE